MVFVTVAVAVALVFGAVAAAMFFVYSIGTVVVPLHVEVEVLDRESGAPVPDALLAFETGTPGVYPRTRARTDARGRVEARSTWSYVTSPFLAYRRDRAPEVRFFLGEPPRYGTYEEVESWTVLVRFREPWRHGGEVVPALEVSRGLAHEEVLRPPEGKKWQLAGSTPLPALPVERLARGVVRFEREGARVAYRILLTVLLDAEQVAACRGGSGTAAGQQ